MSLDGLTREFVMPHASKPLRTNKGPLFGLLLASLGPLFGIFWTLLGHRFHHRQLSCGMVVFWAPLGPAPGEWTGQIRGPSLARFWLSVGFHIGALVFASFCAFVCSKGTQEARKKPLFLDLGWSLLIRTLF